MTYRTFYWKSALGLRMSAFITGYSRWRNPVQPEALLSTMKRRRASLLGIGIYGQLSLGVAEVALFSQSNAEQRVTECTLSIIAASWLIPGHVRLLDRFQESVLVKGISFMN